LENKLVMQQSSNRKESNLSLEPEATTKMEGQQKSSRGMENSKPNSDLPKLFQKIKFKVFGNEKCFQGKVLRRSKPKSVNKNVVVIKLDDGSEQIVNFFKDISEWSDVNDETVKTEELCCLHNFSENKDILHSNYLTILTKSQWKGRPDIKPAMDQEIKKFEDFGAFTRVKDEGQYAIKTRWVISESDDDSKGSRLKARLCMRGDTEENIDMIRADSPTAHKDSLKLALAIAANENFDLVSRDIKSAFLQGMSLERQVYVVPPLEANEPDKLWLLEKGAYGLLDGSRLFYLELKKKLVSLGMKPVSGDPALFTIHENNQLIGFVCIHVDDLLMAGNYRFRQVIREKLIKHFKFSKMEEGKFTYLGCQIEKLSSGDITLNQNTYIQKIENVDVPSKHSSSPVSEFERREIRRVVGALLWVSLMTRPDISYEVNKLSSELSTATLKELFKGCRKAG
jgi:hypothetical protein